MHKFPSSPERISLFIAGSVIRKGEGIEGHGKAEEILPQAKKAEGRTCIHAEEEIIGYGAHREL
jgi:hypothetical protein